MATKQLTRREHAYMLGRMAQAVDAITTRAMCRPRTEAGRELMWAVDTILDGVPELRELVEGEVVALAGYMTDG